MSNEVPWIPLREAARHLGVTLKTAQNALSEGTFPLPTYKLGKMRVVDKEILQQFFELKRARGHAELDRTFHGRR